MKTLFVMLTALLSFAASGQDWFFLWKDGSEQEGVFWNELDFEKPEAECRMETNTNFGDPEEIDPVKHKPTRIALEEVMRGKIHFTVRDGDEG